MNPVIITALIGASGSVIGAFIGVLASAKLTTYRIEQLEKKVDKHNNLIERTYNLEKKEEILDQRLKVQEHRMQDVEKEIHYERT